MLAGLNAVGEDMSSPYIRKAVQWLKSKQNADGGWGEAVILRSISFKRLYRAKHPLTDRLGDSCNDRCGEAGGREVMNGVTYLLKRQKADGTWDEKEFTGTGFPKYVLSPIS